MNNGNLKLTLCALAILLGGALFGAIVMWLSPFVTSLPLSTFLRIRDIATTYSLFCTIYGLIGLAVIVFLSFKMRPVSMGSKIYRVILVAGGIFCWLWFWAFTVDFNYKIWEQTSGEETVFISYKGGKHYTDRWRNPIFEDSDYMLGVGFDKNLKTVFIGYDSYSASPYDCSQFNVQIYDSEFKLSQEIAIPEFQGDDIGYDVIIDKIRRELRKRNIYL